MFENLRRKFRSHKFDLKNPLKATMGKTAFEGFRCSVCGKTLWLDLWQMNDLPFSMGRGCPGTFNPDEPQTPVIIAIESGPIKDDPCDIYVAGVSRPNQDRRKAPCKCGHRLEVNEHFCPICGTAAH
jgi:hypothetical protein